MSVLPFIGVFSFVFAIALIIWWQRRKKRYSPLVEPALRLPGHSLSIKVDEMWDNLLFLYVILSLIPFIYIIALSLEKDSSPSLMAIGLCMIFGIVAIIILAKEILKIRDYQLGRDGEIYVGQELNLLMRDGAWVFHDIRYQYGNIDHVVISTGGVFAIETKTARKPTGKNGKKEHIAVVSGEKILKPALGSEPIEQAERHAMHLRKCFEKELNLQPHIVSCVALPGWFVKPNPLYVKKKVIVINPKRVTSLRRLVSRRLISEEDMKKIAAFFDRRGRTQLSKADITDPNASEKYTLLMSRKSDGYDI